MFKAFRRNRFFVGIEVERNNIKVAVINNRHQNFEVLTLPYDDKSGALGNVNWAHVSNVMKHEFALGGCYGISVPHEEAHIDEIILPSHFNDEQIVNEIRKRINLAESNSAIDFIKRELHTLDSNIHFVALPKHPIENYYQQFKLQGLKLNLIDIDIFAYLRGCQLYFPRLTKTAKVKALIFPCEHEYLFIVYDQSRLLLHQSWTKDLKREELESKLNHYQLAFPNERIKCLMQFFVGFLQVDIEEVYDLSQLEKMKEIDLPLTYLLVVGLLQNERLYL